MAYDPISDTIVLHGGASTAEDSLLTQQDTTWILHQERLYDVPLIVDRFDRPSSTEVGPTNYPGIAWTESASFNTKIVEAAGGGYLSGEFAPGDAPSTVKVSHGRPLENNNFELTGSFQWGEATNSKLSIFVNADGATSLSTGVGIQFNSVSSAFALMTDFDPSTSSVGGVVTGGYNATDTYEFHFKRQNGQYSLFVCRLPGCTEMLNKSTPVSGLTAGTGNQLAIQFEAPAGSPIRIHDIELNLLP